MNIASRLRLCALPLAVSLALAACGGSSAPSAATDTAAPPATAEGQPAAVELPAGWQRVAGAEVPALTGQSPALPTAVQSDDGAQAEVSDISRIIAGGDDVIAVLEALGLGKQVFAAPTNTTTQAGQASPHQFLFNRTTGVEGVVSLHGSLFLGNSLRRHTVLASKLREVGESAVVIDDLQPAPDKVRKVAAAVGLADVGQTLATEVQRQLDEAAAIGKGLAHAPRVIHVSATGGGGTPTVAGADSASAEMIALAGGINVGSEAGVKNYSQLSNEGVIAAAPEVILVTEHDLQQFGGADGLWKAYPTLKQTPAGAANRVWVMPDVQLKYTSVGTGAGALALAKALAALPPA